MGLVVVSGAGELGLLADGLREDDTLLEQEHVQLLALVAGAVRVRHDHRLLEHQLPLRGDVALRRNTWPFTRGRLAVGLLGTSRMYTLDNIPTLIS